MGWWHSLVKGVSHVVHDVSKKVTGTVKDVGHFVTHPVEDTKHALQEVGKGITEVAHATHLDSALHRVEKNISGTVGDVKHVVHNIENEIEKDAKRVQKALHHHVCDQDAKIHSKIPYARYADCWSGDGTDKALKCMGRHGREDIDKTVGAFKSVLDTGAEFANCVRTDVGGNPLNAVKIAAKFTPIGAAFNALSGGGMETGSCDLTDTRLWKAMDNFAPIGCVTRSAESIECASHLASKGIKHVAKPGDKASEGYRKWYSGVDANSDYKSRKCKEAYVNTALNCSLAAVDAFAPGVGEEIGAGVKAATNSARAGKVSAFAFKQATNATKSGLVSLRDKSGREPLPWEHHHLDRHNRHSVIAKRVFGCKEWTDEEWEHEQRGAAIDLMRESGGVLTYAEARDRIDHR